MAIDSSQFSSFGSGAGGLLSLGGGIFGAVAGASQARQINQDYTNIAQTQSQENALRRTQMELTTRRQQTENIRQTQYARSMGLTAATSQGAAYGESSGYRGGLNTATSQGGVDAQTLNQNLFSGEKMFNLNDQLNAQQKYLAQDQSAMQGIQGMASMLGNIGKAGGNIGTLASMIPGMFPA